MDNKDKDSLILDPETCVLSRDMELKVERVLTPRPANVQAKALPSNNYDVNTTQ